MAEMERRREEWAADEPRQRREEEWPEGQVRQRRHWSDFRDAYPRIVTAMALGMLVLFAADAALLYKRSEYRRESGAARGSMTALEKQRADALLESKEARTALMAALVQQQSVRESKLNLSISLEESTMALQQDGSELRTMPVEIGPEVSVGQDPGAIKVTPPLGKRQVSRVVDDSYVWEAPEWVYSSRGQAVPASRAIRGGLGPLAVLLDDGTPLYSKPSEGPLAEESYVLPGAVRLEAADLKAIRVNLSAGTPVYFYR
jgi:hypothetical protein